MRILRATAAERAVALRILNLPAQTTYTYSPILFVAKPSSSPRIVGALMIQPLSAATAVVLPPRAVDREYAEFIESALAAEAQAYLEVSDIAYAQALFTAKELFDGQGNTLLDAGFRYLTRLELYQRDIQKADRVNIPRPQLQYVPFSQIAPSIYSATLQATYDGSLDCPELNNVHAIEDTLTSYLHNPESPTFCWVVCSSNRPIGVVILTTPVLSTRLEVTYLGLIPSVRGLGLGKELMNFVIWHAISIAASGIQLSVDKRNSPALRLYLGKGFWLYDEREVLIWMHTPAP